MKKTAAVRLAACLLAAAVAGAPLPSWAGSPPATGGEIAAEKSVMVGQQAAEDGQSMSLEKAITLVKGRIPVPGALDMFNSDYQEYGGSGRWLLRWHSGKSPEYNMNVTVNTGTGEIENVNMYKGIKPGAQYRGLPAFSREQCLEIARKEAARMLPDKYSSTVLVPREQWYQPSVLRERDYPIINDFSFKRTSGGIRVSDQGINVGVNAETGEVVRLDCSWSPGAAFPSPVGRVSADEAKKIFMEKAGYELTYFMPSQADPDQPGDMRLVYRQKPPGRFILNAITGEMFDGRDVDFFFDEMGGGGGGGGPMYNRKMQSKALTPAESRVVKETGDLISADRAQEIARSLVEVPKDYTAASRNLERRYPIPESRVWNVQFTDSEKKNRIWVTVDAKTGELFSFNRDSGMNPEEYYKEPQVKFSQEESQKIAWKLISGLQPARSAKVEFRQADPEMGPWVKAGKVAARGYNFSYARMVDGIVYPDQGFRVRVSSTTGEVLSYDMTWWEPVFPKAQGVIGTAAANEKFLADHQLALEYSRGHRRWSMDKEPPAYYLIYRPSGIPGAMLDALTGQEIDYQGNPVVKKGKQPFSDITGHQAEGDIMLLAGEGIITGDGGKFRPDDPATGAEVLAMLVKAYSQRGPYYPLAAAKNDPWYKPVMESALAKGILEKDFTIDPEAGLNRLQLARLGINAGGWGKLARLSQIFRLDVNDAGAVPADFRGYVAAALGMEMIAAENGSFNPEGKVTRAEAATFLVSLMKQ